jgi:hypothetical protein
MPRGTAGLVLEAQGAGFYCMYVDPNGRYAPAAHDHNGVYSAVGHTHSMDDIINGGVTANVIVGDGAGGTKTLHFTNGKYSSTT